MSMPEGSDPEALGAQPHDLTSMRSALTQTERLVHELRVHQIELEIQNRALSDAQEQLESSRERYVELFDFAPMAYLTLEADGRIVEANLTAARMVGQDRSFLHGRRLQTVVGMVDPLAFRSLLRATAEQGTPSSAELTFRTPAQQTYVVEAVAIPVHRSRPGPVRVAMHDITARATAEQNLHFLSQAGARLNRIPLESPQLLEEIAAAGAFGSVDGCWVEMEGAETSAWRTEPLRRKMTGELLRRVALQVSGTIQLTRANGRARVGRWTEDLGSRPQWPAVRSWVTAPLTVRGEIRGTLTLFQDLPPEAGAPSMTLTEDFARRASMVLEDSALRRRVEEATRARDEMMAVLAHDVSNALFSFRLHTQRGLVRGGEQAQRALGVVARGSQWLLGLVKTVIDVAGMDGEKIRVQPQPGNLAQVLESACALQQMDADDRHLVVERAWPAELLLDFDQERILQVLFNLVNNAVKFTPVGGRVVVGAEHDGRQVRIWVRDSGTGLQPEEVERVFERGWQANPKAGGKGLGLYISQRIVEAHGGTVWVESTPGHGATFHVSLPVDSGARVSPQDETSVAP